MPQKSFNFLAPLLLLALAASTHAQSTYGPLATARVSTASLPLPLPGDRPMLPIREREANPWVIPMTGSWKFELTHGKIANASFIPADSVTSITASTTQSGNDPQNAFDGSRDTRWTASSGDYPQWLAADLGQPRRVTGITVTWERARQKYFFKVEGSLDNSQWSVLSDKSVAGAGNGPVNVVPADVRYVRITVTGAERDWASISEFEIHLLEGGKDIVWTPQPDPAALTRADSVFAPTFSDRQWDTVSVPSNWEMAGYSLPTYNSVDNTVGLYRRWVNVPKSFAGRRIYWRFDGALDGAEVYINGQRAGYHESGYTAWDIDVTGLVQPGKLNLFALRVSKETPSVDADTGDFQCMGGVYRDNYLIAVPQTHIQDLTLRTPLDSAYRNATLQADVLAAGRPGSPVNLTGMVYDGDGTPTSVRLSGAGSIGSSGSVLLPLSARVTAPRLWSAESPSLYYLVLCISQNGKPIERIEQRFGFRQVEFKNNILLWNGRPIKLTGTCRHDFWPTKGFALTDREWLRDLTLMKGANINAIRTSHYNHAARFLELCDEMGFYILDEVPFCWINEKNNDPAFAPALLRRAADTLGRDKNRPCVMAWSLGNENGVGSNSQIVIDYVKGLDKTRPAFISWGGPWGPKGQPVEDRHYPTPQDVDNYLAKDARIIPAWFSEQPHMFSQKESEDYDPGISDLWSEVLIGTWDKIWPAPTIAGSFVWEWQNQGIADKNKDHTTDFYYGTDHLRQENNKGVVDEFRNPKPEYWAVKMVYSPVAMTINSVVPTNGRFNIPLQSRYSFTDLKTLTCHWTCYSGGTVLRTGAVHIPCPPDEGTVATFPAVPGTTVLRLDFNHPDGSSVVSWRIPVAGAPSPEAPSGMNSADPLLAFSGPDQLTVRNSLQTVSIDQHTGAIHRWDVQGRDMLVGDSVLDIGQGRAPTGGVKDHLQAARPPVTRDAQVTYASINGSVNVSVHSIVSGIDGGPDLGTLDCVYDVTPSAEIFVHWTLTWTAADAHLWEVGIKLPLSQQYSQMSWFRDSYFTDYPEGHLGEPSGTCQAGDVSFRSSKRSLHWMALTDINGNGVVLQEDPDHLIGRAIPNGQAIDLCASREVAPPEYLSTAWVAYHEIIASASKPLSGNFILKAIGRQNP